MSGDCGAGAYGPPVGPVATRPAGEPGSGTANIGEEHLHAELGELVEGTRPGRTVDDQSTLYKSVGVAAQDAAAVALVLWAAREQGVGTDVLL
jgi:ornithine cyclodeaminase/alanine dehydrogenase-like protein (mu-crystallin family)